MTPSTDAAPPDTIAPPGSLFRLVARAEAVTWALLLTGMFLKYVTRTTEVGVQLGGMLHGVVFVAYVVVSLAVAVDARWSAGRTVVALLSAVPPFATLWFERSADRRRDLPAAWRLRGTAPSSTRERVLAGLLRRPLGGALVGLGVVAALTGLALLVGPPTG
jgi:integral membrane protein